MELKDIIEAPGLAYWPADTSLPVLDMSIGEALHHAVHQWGSSIALVDGDPCGTRRRWSYEELLAESVQVARALLKRFSPGEHVAIWAPNCPEWVFVEFGAALAGVTLVTVNPSYLAKELSYVLAQSKSAGIIAVPEYRGRNLLELLDEVRPDLPLLRDVISLGQWEAFKGSATGSIPLPEVSPDAIAQVQYTSGTTGFPKGTLLAHRGLVNNGYWFASVIQARAGNVWVNPMPMFHTAGCVLVTLGALETGGTIVLPAAFDPAHIVELFESEKGNLLVCVPTMMVRILDLPDIASRDLSSWHFAAVGGAPVPLELVGRASDQLGVEIGIGFGQTEASPYISHTRRNEERAGLLTTVGRPLPQVEVKIVSPATESTVAMGQVGEIWTRSCCVMKGYFENPEATASAITASGWLRTGDLGSMDADGYIKIRGRIKEMIIRGGENVYPREVEDVLIQHPDVLMASVVGIPDHEWGEVVAAFVQMKSGKSSTGQQLMDFCRVHLASHKVPRIWRFVDAYPQTPSGKIQKFQLRESILREAERGDLEEH